MLSYTTPQPSHARRRALLLVGILCQTHALGLPTAARDADHPTQHVNTQRRNAQQNNPKKPPTFWEDYGIMTVVGTVIALILGALLYYQCFATKAKERTLALIKPDAVDKTDEIVDIIKSKGFKVVQQKTFQLSKEKAKEFYHEHSQRGFFSDLVKNITSGNLTALVLEKDKAVQAWRDLMGPMNPVHAKTDAPNSIRAKYGTDIEKNAVHGAESIEAAKREIQVIFG